jgi:hypothetical protein
VTPGLVRRVWVVWVLLRLVIVAVGLFPREAGNLADISTFHEWTVGYWEHGVVPGRDFDWEYPYGAAPFLLVPLGVQGPWWVYGIIAAECLALDAALQGFLLRLGQRRGSAVGALLWLLWVPLLGPLLITRFDLVPAVLAAGGVALAVTRPRAAGAVLGIAITTKLWPAVLLLLVLVAVPDRRRVLGGAAGGVAAMTAIGAAMGVLPSALTAVTHQLDRGVQVESLAGLPGLWAAVAGSDPLPAYRHGSWEVTSDVSSALAVGLFCLGTVLVLLLLRSARRVSATHLPLLAAEIMLVVVLTDKVFSPQYLVWVLPLVAVAACRAGAIRSLPVVTSVAVLVLTHLVYPLTYNDLLAGQALPAAILTARDVLLIALLVMLHRGRTRPARSL